MATPKKVNKIRDYDKTRKRLLEIVGEILNETGFRDLKTNHIARRLGKDKNLIRYYFDNLNNLKRTFILENDHWIKVLKELELSGNLDKNEIKALFKRLAHEHFVFFEKNPEMQKIMLWQLADKSPLVKSISELRAKESERLIKTATPFLNSEPHFRMVMDLVFGGLYFLTLNSGSGNGTLWGVDLNIVKDRTALLGVVDQIIDWAWTYNG